MLWVHESIPLVLSDFKSAQPKVSVQLLSILDMLHPNLLQLSKQDVGNVEQEAM